MPTLHGFACKNLNFPHPAAPVLARPESLHAPALKAPQEAGRRGGESIARWLDILILFLARKSVIKKPPERRLQNEGINKQF
ncbi:TPA: hypothetical protein I8170_001959 [Citrobacter freundii]|uniref:hypothetical protein n=1 Tax=Escherichia coli TaxID=562 RepID=UPI000DE57FF9|nr:hypothetical protein [Escherichia coli]HAT2215862.1 hypothetical protein [Citrobacter freundii]